MPQIEMLHHMLGEHRMQSETRETGVIDCEWGPELSTLGLEIGGLPFSFSSSKEVWKAHREQKPHRVIHNHLH